MQRLTTMIYHGCLAWQSTAATELYLPSMLILFHWHMFLQISRLSHLPSIPCSISSSHGNSLIISHEGNGMWRKKASLHLSFSSSTTWKSQYIFTDQLKYAWASKQNFSQKVIFLWHAMKRCKISRIQNLLHPRLTDGAVVVGLTCRPNA